MNGSAEYPWSTGYDEKHTEKSVDTKFLGLQTDNLNWKNHTD